MYNFDQPLLVAGMLLGLSSSLHCFGMCSGIAAELDSRRPARSLLATTLLINGGRIAGYMIAGAIVAPVTTIRGFRIVLARSQHSSKLLQQAYSSGDAAPTGLRCC